MPVLVFATNNPHKLKEAKAILPSFVTLRSLREIGCEDELPETGATLEANAFQKADYVYRKFGLPCIADDTGLEVEALGGAPGVFSARYAGTGADTQRNMEKLLRELNGVVNRTARFRTVVTLLGMDEPRYFEGTVEGMIIDLPRGEGGFGYDPVFLPAGHSETFAEMSPSLKNTLSHRGKALRSMSDWIAARLDSGF